MLPAALPDLPRHVLGWLDCPDPVGCALVLLNCVLHQIVFGTC